MNRAHRYLDLCWITDYFAEECWRRACVHSLSPFHPCLPRDDAPADGEVGDVA